MDFMTALDIGASGMSADRTQLNVTAMNLANAKTTRMPGGNGPYQRKSVIKATSDLDNPFGHHMRTELDRAVKGVRVRAWPWTPARPSASTSPATPTPTPRATWNIPTSTWWRKWPT